MRTGCSSEAAARVLEESQGETDELKGLIEVTVHTMAGSSFGVMLEGGGSNSNVHALKAEIKKAEGAPSLQQELFMLVEGVEDGSEEPLLDDLEIVSACTVSLCVKPEEECVGVGRGF